MHATDADALLDRQAARQRAAEAVVDDLRLIERLSEVGRLVRTGSAALGLMVARDIDITTLCPELDITAVFDVGRALAEHPRVHKLGFRNDTGRWNTDPEYPDGLYWLVEYVEDGGDAWSLDLWFLREGTTQYDLEAVRTLPLRLDRDARIAILEIKEHLNELPPANRIPSATVCDAVLDGGVRSVEAFERYVARRSEP